MPRCAGSTRASVPTPALTVPPGHYFQEAFVSMHKGQPARINGNALAAFLHGLVLDGDSRRLDDRTPLFRLDLDVTAECFGRRAADEQAEPFELAFHDRAGERGADV